MKTFYYFFFFSLIFSNSLFAVPYSKILLQDERQIHISLKDSFSWWGDAKQIASDHCANHNKYALLVKRPGFLKSKLDKYYKKKGLLMKRHQVAEYICSKKNLVVAPSYAFSAGEKIDPMYSNFGEDILNNNISSQNQSTDITFSFDDKKKQCEAIGFKPMTEKFADCVLKLVELDVQTQNNNNIAAANNAGNKLLANELKNKRQSENSRYLIELGQQLMKPQSNNNFSRTTSCTVSSFGNQSKINCF